MYKLSIENPTAKNCWTPCVSCHRCADKGTMSKCQGCSGRYDPARRIYPDADDYCDCRNGILRWKTQDGRKIVSKLPGNPYKSKVQTEKTTQDEEDWNSYLKDEKERRNDENWDPLLFDDGSSTNAWMDSYKRGY